ncbi:P-loop_containing nucleoside triphosphate hydrolase [Hexamita inflata]|uniref:P-loop_containing nucleoside triphosphate hydrolase n=1 Tax=Hexamita inflata TaxID=28002 RepID=A0ABP1JVC2_9EUKA
MTSKSVFPPVGLKMQLSSILNAVSNLEEINLPSTILIQGPRGTGKRTLINFALKDAKVPVKIFDGAIHSPQDVISGFSSNSETTTQSSSFFIQLQQFVSSSFQQPQILVLHNFNYFTDEFLYKIADQIHSNSPLLLIMTTTSIQADEQLSMRVKSRLVYDQLKTIPTDDDLQEFKLDVPINVKQALKILTVILTEFFSDLSVLQNDQIVQMVRNQLRKTASLQFFSDLAQKIISQLDVFNCKSSKIQKQQLKIQQVIAAFNQCPPILQQLSKEAKICLKLLSQLEKPTQSALETAISQIPEQKTQLFHKIISDSVFELQRLEIVRVKNKTYELLIDKEDMKEQGIWV